MAGLEFALFGGFRLSFDGERLPSIPSRASRSLLAHLVLHRGQPHTRDRLVATFWPDLPEPRGRRRLSHTLWQVQDALGELPTDHRYVEAVGDTLAFNVDAPHEVDVDQFERRVERYRPGRRDRSTPGDLGRLESVLELYAGVLLEGLDDTWVLPERERLAALHVDALGWMVELARGQGAFEQALVHARRLTHHDPLREDGHREVMRLCTLLGRTSEALRQYDRCRSVLAEELGTEPAKATQQLAEFVARQRGAPVRDPVTDTAEEPHGDLRLVGRDLERATLVEGLERTLAGAGGVSLVEGGAGVGKTRLLRQVADDAQWRGFTVAHGVCEVGGGLPYLAIAEAVTPLLSPVRIAQLRPRVGDEWLAQVGRVVPRLARPRSSSAAAGLTTDAADRMREAFTRLLTGLADIEPTLLVVEDVHEADAETLQVLQWVAGRLQERRLHLVLAFRGNEARAREDVWSTLRSVDIAAIPDRVLLEPLTAFGTAELVREVLGGDAAPALATRIHDETGGNPLFVLETVRAVRDRGGIGPDGGEDLPLPGSIRDVTIGRVQLLSPTVREVLAAAAVQTHAVHLDVLAHVTATVDQPGVVGDAVADLLRRGLLVEQPEGYGFRHELLRRIVVDELDDEVRADLHGRVADALEVHHGDRIEDLARHRDAAGQIGRAVAAWQAAAERAVALHAHRTAQGHFARAVELQRRRPAAVEARRRLLAAYEDVLSVLGDHEEQAAVLDELTTLAGTTGPAAADVARRRAWLAAHTDQYEVAEAEAARAVDLADDDDAARAAALTVMGTARSWRGDHESAVTALTVGITTHAAAASREQAHVALGSSLQALGRFDEAVEALSDAVAACREEDDVHGESRAMSGLAAVRMEQGAVAEAVAGYESALEQCRRIGYRHGEGVNLVNLGNALYVDNDVTGALQHYDAAAEVFASIGNARGRANVQVNAAIARHEVLGDDERAREDAHAALAWFTQTGDARAIATCQHTLASLHLRRGDLDAARRRLDLAGPHAASDPTTGAQVAQLEGAIALADGDLAAAETALGRALELAHAAGRGGLAVRVRADRARVRLAAGDLAGADDDSLAAVAGLDDAVERPCVVWWARHLVAATCGGDDADAALARAVAHLEASLLDVPADLRARAESAVPEHAEILAARAASEPRRITLRVAGAEVPIGRPLAPDDMRDVHVELDVDDVRGAAGRRDALVDIVRQVRRQGGAPTVDDLAQALGVSASTVRRDLTALRDAGVAVETRGSRAS